MTNIINTLAYAAAIGAILLVVKYVTMSVIYVFSRFSKAVWAALDIKEDLIGAAIISFLFFCGMILFGFLDITTSYWTAIGISVLLASIPLTYSYLIHPILYLIKNKKFTKYNFTLSHKTPENIKFFIIEKKVLNAYSTGVLPFTKIILLGRTALEKLSPEDTESLIFHEIGHINRNHLLKLYVANIIFLILYVMLLRYLMPTYTQHAYPGLLIGLHGGIGIGLCLPMYLGLFQRTLEKEADSYAAKIVGKDQYKKMLVNLNEVTNGGLNVWSFNYPKLNERLANVDKI